MTSEGIPDAQRFAGVALLFMGQVSMTYSLAYLAIRFAFGRPLLERAVIGAVLGCAVGLVGYRMAGGKWAGSSQIPHRTAALAGFFFLTALLWAGLEHHWAPASPHVWALAAASALAILTWYWRGRRRRHGA